VSRRRCQCYGRGAPSSRGYDAATDLARHIYRRRLAVWDEWDAVGRDTDFPKGS